MFFSPVSATNLLLNCSVFTQNKTLTSIQLILKITAWNILNYSIIHSICYSIWVLYLEKNHPMPFSGLIALPVWIALLCGIWILFPAELLSEEEFKKHLKTYVLYSIWWFVMNIQKDILTLFSRPRLCTWNGFFICCSMLWGDQQTGLDKISP